MWDILDDKKVEYVRIERSKWNATSTYI
jgi:hypothetical protein